MMTSLVRGAWSRTQAAPQRRMVKLGAIAERIKPNRVVVPAYGALPRTIASTLRVALPPLVMMTSVRGAWSRTQAAPQRRMVKLGAIAQRITPNRVVVPAYGALLRTIASTSRVALPPLVMMTSLVRGAWSRTQAAPQICMVKLGAIAQRIKPNRVVAPAYGALLGTVASTLRVALPLPVMMTSVRGAWSRTSAAIRKRTTTPGAFAHRTMSQQRPQVQRRRRHALQRPRRAPRQRQTLVTRPARRHVQQRRRLVLLPRRHALRLRRRAQPRRRHAPRRPRRAPRLPQTLVTRPRNSWASPPRRWATVLQALRTSGRCNSAGGSGCSPCRPSSCASLPWSRSRSALSGPGRRRAAWGRGHLAGMTSSPTKKHWWRTWSERAG